MTVEAGAPDSLQAAMVRLGRSLRDDGLAVTPAESLDGVRALGAVDLSDRTEVYLALRSVFTTRPADVPFFNRAFDEVFGSTSPRPVDEALRSERSQRTGQARVRRRTPREAAVFLRQWMDGARAPDAEPVKVPTMSDRPGAAPHNLAQFSDTELEELERVAARIARRLANRKGRRWKAARRGARIDLRRTLRRLSSTGGELAELAYRTRAPRKTRLVVLCDVSGSMELHAHLLLQFLFALQRQFARVETFVFSTELERITEALRAGTYRIALQRLSRDVEGWSGGTKIGESLRTFVRAWPGLVDRHTVVVVLSDGWDTGPPEVLAESLAALGRRASRVVWLNPLLASPGYEPVTAGMAAALPHLDVFAPCHDVDSLAALDRHLTL